MSNLVDRVHSALLEDDTDMVRDLIPTSAAYFDLINGRGLSNQDSNKIKSSSDFLSKVTEKTIQTTFIDLVLMFKNKEILKHLHDLGVLIKATSYLMGKSSSMAQTDRHQKWLVFILDSIDFTTRELVSLTQEANRNNYEFMAIACLDKITDSQGFKSDFNTFLTAAFKQGKHHLIKAVLEKYPGLIDDKDNRLRASSFVILVDFSFEKMSSLFEAVDTGYFINIHNHEVDFLTFKKDTSQAKVSP